MILIDAVFINTGGGKVLLDYLIESIEVSKLNVFYLFDKRYHNDAVQIPKEKCLYLNPSIIARHLFYIKNKSKFSKVFCFGNLPPTIKLSVPVYTYFHNVLTFDFPKSHPVRAKVKNLFKIFLFKVISKNTDSFIVQTNSVKQLLNKRIGFENDKIKILPFFNVKYSTNDSTLREANSYIYVSSGASHKNHLWLLSAFEKFSLLTSNNPVLVLTIEDKYQNIISEINKLKKKGIKITNLGNIKHTDLCRYYKSSKYCLYVSQRESFGLPLIEAALFGCRVIAPDLDYAKDVIVPSAFYKNNNIDEFINILLQSYNFDLHETIPIVTDKSLDIINLLKSNQC